ncbi:MAG TPA: DinB family protein [Verrucomicrobiae bacterium]|nr:DinB family protein [Verrucomicrobiae bacterium]
MKKAFAITTLGLLCLTASATATRAAGPLNQMPSAVSDDKTSPSYDMKAQALVDLQQLQKKYVDLAQAIPADKYTWRPEPGTRSVSELFLHVASANYGIPTMMTGTEPAPGFHREGFEKSTTDKAKVIAQLNESFAYAEAAVKKMSNADFAKAEKKLGPDANDGDVVYILVTHNHEHLGQSIAYARMNGITPPWTEEAQKKEKPAAD